MTRHELLHRVVRIIARKWAECGTLVPKVFLDFSSFREAARKKKINLSRRFAALSQLSHAEKNQEKPLGPG